MTGLKNEGSMQSATKFESIPTFVSSILRSRLENNRLRWDELENHVKAKSKPKIVARSCNIREFFMLN